MVRNHPEVPDSQIAKLLGTTKTTIQSIRDRSHWNAANLQPQDPVGLGLCTQIDLDAVVRKAAAKAAKLRPVGAETPTEGPTLEPVSETVPAEPTTDEDNAQKVDLDKVFASLGGSDNTNSSD